ncbi:MAG: adenylyl-sulfate kinase [Rhodocyclaceae bacterium]|nr:adenylyl-sulfate kinase [Rhodocyclaceae bacterium]
MERRARLRRRGRAPRPRLLPAQPRRVRRCPLTGPPWSSLPTDPTSAGISSWSPAACARRATATAASWYGADGAAQFRQINFSAWRGGETFAGNYAAYVLDGDNVRHGLCRDLGFAEQDRAENIRRIGEVANLFLDAGIILLAAFVSPYEADRQAVRTLVGAERFIEVFCRCPVEVCEARDEKGNYAKARAGAIARFTGISAPYEAPLEADLALDTDRTDIQTSVSTVLSLLRERCTLSANGEGHAV